MSSRLLGDIDLTPSKCLRLPSPPPPPPPPPQPQARPPHAPQLKDAVASSKGEVHAVAEAAEHMAAQACAVAAEASVTTQPIDCKQALRPLRGPPPRPSSYHTYGSTAATSTAWLASTAALTPSSALVTTATATGQWRTPRAADLFTGGSSTSSSAASSYVHGRRAIMHRVIGNVLPAPVPNATAAAAAAAAASSTGGGGRSAEDGQPLSPPQRFAHWRLPPGAFTIPEHREGFEAHNERQASEQRCSALPLPPLHMASGALDHDASAAAEGGAAAQLPAFDASDTIKTPSNDMSQANDALVATETLPKLDEDLSNLGGSAEAPIRLSSKLDRAATVPALFQSAVKAQAANSSALPAPALTRLRFAVGSCLGAKAGSAVVNRSFPCSGTASFKGSVATRARSIEELTQSPVASSGSRSDDSAKSPSFAAAARALSGRLLCCVFPAHAERTKAARLTSGKCKSADASSDGSSAAIKCAASQDGSAHITDCVRAYAPVSTSTSAASSATAPTSDGSVNTFWTLQTSACTSVPATMHSVAAGSGGAHG